MLVSINRRLAHPRRKNHRTGGIAVLAAAFLVAVVLIVAFAVDTGHITLVKTQLQNSADAGALAGGWGLFDSPGKARNEAEKYAEDHKAAGSKVKVTKSEDIELGLWNDQTRVFTALPSANESNASALRLTTRLTAARGNAMEHFFANMMGHGASDISATAVAAMGKNFTGFKVPPDGSNQPILPFAVDLGTWQGINSGSDNFEWDPVTSQVVSGSDGAREIDIYPKGNGAPGNRGLLEFGPNGGNTNTLRSQITNGLPPSDLNHHGGSIKLNNSGNLTLGGKPGVKATLGSEFSQIIGETRIIPIFDSTSGGGNNVTYNIMKFVAVRFVDVKMNGGNSKIIVQPASINISGGIANTGGTQTSHDIYSNPILVQ